jgi:hypothetical protein
MSYIEPTVLGRTLSDIVQTAKARGIDHIPMSQDFLAPALAMMSRGEITAANPNPQYAPGNGIIIVIGEAL